MAATVKARNNLTTARAKIVEQERNVQRVSDAVGAAGETDIAKIVEASAEVAERQAKAAVVRKANATRLKSFEQKVHARTRAAKDLEGDVAGSNPGSDYRRLINPASI